MCITEAEFSSIFLEGTIEEFREILHEENEEIDDIIHNYWLICDKDFKPNLIAKIDILLKDPRFKLTEDAICLPIYYKHNELAKYVLDYSGRYQEGAKAAANHENMDVFKHCVDSLTFYTSDQIYDIIESAACGYEYLKYLFNNIDIPEKIDVTKPIRIAQCCKKDKCVELLESHPILEGFDGWSLV